MVHYELSKGSSVLSAKSEKNICRACLLWLLPKKYQSKLIGFITTTVILYYVDRTTAFAVYVNCLDIVWYMYRMEKVFIK